MHVHVCACVVCVFFLCVLRRVLEIAWRVAPMHIVAEVDFRDIMLNSTHFARWVTRATRKFTSAQRYLGFDFPIPVVRTRVTVVADLALTNKQLTFHGVVLKDV